MKKESKLKEKPANEVALGKKLRTGKKVTKLTPKEKEEIKHLRDKGRKLARAQSMSTDPIHRGVSENNRDENVGVEATDRSLQFVEGAGRKVVRKHYSQKAKQLEKLKAGRGTAGAGHGTATGGKVEAGIKETQRNRMKRELIEQYQRQKAKEAANTAGGLGKKFVDQAEDIVGKIGEWIKEHVLENPLGLILGLAIALVLLVITSSFSSCSLIMGGMGNSTLAGTFTAEDAAIQGVEADYTALENGLRNQVSTVETNYPGYDEYRYNVAEIGHNAYQLTALLTVLYEDFTRQEVQAKLHEIFVAQYTFSTEEVVEIRTRTVTKIRSERRTREEEREGTRRVWDPVKHKFVDETYTYTVEVEYWVDVEYEEEEEYEYYILNVTLTNATLDAVVQSMNLNAEQMERYTLMLQTLGNRPDIFSGSIYDIPLPGEFTDYGIPPEYLTDEQFANMIQEAEKYLGYPYVWGGASPSTSFDCSGFVSYVINNCGNGWSMGRQTANGLLAHCTPIPREEAKPGDLIFFAGTYDTAGASHVGIYVGDGMMLHCGNPIQYASINTTYWQNHFYTFGRIN